MLLDESPFCGGNSTKATSGVNGAETKTQKAKDIQDSVDLFISDTLKGGAKQPEVAKVLLRHDASLASKRNNKGKTPYETQEPEIRTAINDCTVGERDRSGMPPSLRIGSH